MHLAIGTVGRIGVYPDRAETHARLPPAQYGTTAGRPTAPTESLAASRKPMVAMVCDRGTMECPAGRNATRSRRSDIWHEERGADRSSHGDHCKYQFDHAVLLSTDIPWLLARTQRSPAETGRGANIDTAVVLTAASILPR
jgi:hypothetical protein